MNSHRNQNRLFFKESEVKKSSRFQTLILNKLIKYILKHIIRIFILVDLIIILRKI